MGITPITNTEEGRARAAWSMLTEPGDEASHAVIARYGYVEGLAVATSRTGSKDLLALSPRMADALKLWRARRPIDVDAALHQAEALGIELVDPSDVPGLSDLGSTAPHVLWVRGDLKALGRPANLSWVGARAATPYGESLTHEIVGSLAADGITIHSGGAYGIDGAAHRAALGRGGSTVVWVAGGGGRAYPIGHQNLFDRIISSKGGAIVSEHAPDAAASKWRFLMRNRLVAAVSPVTIVAEAGWRSGTLNTAGHASALGRQLGAVPGPITSAASAGCHRLIREYDAAVITTAADVRELMPQPAPLAG